MSPKFLHGVLRLACLIDPMQQHCCGLFQQGVAKQGCKRDVRETLRRVFVTWLLPDWETLYRALAYGVSPTVVAPYNTA